MILIILTLFSPMAKIENNVPIANLLERNTTMSTRKNDLQHLDQQWQLKLQHLSRKIETLEQQCHHL